MIIMSIWINIDMPTKHFVIHSKNNSRNPKYKGINKMLRDGGWFELSTVKEAYELHKREYPTFTLVEQTDK